MSEGGKLRDMTRSNLGQELPEPWSAERVHRLLASPSLLAQLPDLVSIVDRELRLVYVGQRRAAASEAELLGKNVLDYVPASLRARFRAAAERCWASGLPQTIEGPNADHGLAERLVPFEDERGAPLLLLTSGIVSDCRRERELSERESWLRHAIEASGVGTWSWDRSSDRIAWDDSLCRIYGLDPKAAPTGYAEYLRYLHPEDRERVESAIAACLQTGSYDDFEHRLIRPNGEVRHVFCRGVAVLDERGWVTGLRGGIFDITDRKRLEEQLRHVQKMEAIGQLTAGIAHNFNNLLSIILPNLELCRAHAPAAAQGPLADIEHAATRATELVLRLMRFARHETGADKSDVDLAAIAERTVSICRSTFDRRIAIELAAQPGLPPVMARAGEIEQVLLNICINARDALEEVRSESPQIRIEVGRGRAYMLCVRVADNGPGIDALTRARLFEPFFTTKQLGRGTGLGLASAYGIVVDHQGSISCHSEPGQGTVFEVELPIAQQSRDRAPLAVAAPVRRGSETILFIDDEPLVRRALGAVLERSGFRVLEANDGREGLALIERHQPKVDLVLLDRSMPGMCGEQFLTQLRALGANLPVVLLSGHPGSETELEGVLAVMMKPPKSAALLSTIRQLLDEPDRQR